MRLCELHGVKRYKDKNLYSVLNDLRQSGGFSHNGDWGMVIGNKSWNYVYKVFTDDWAYLSFVEYVIKHPNPAFPRFFGPPRLVTPFYSRERSHDQVYIVKMEKLEPLPAELGWIVELISHSTNYLSYINDIDDPELAEKRKAYYELLAQKKEHVRQFELGRSNMSQRESRRYREELDDEMRALYPYPRFADFEEAFRSHPNLRSTILAWNHALQHVEAAPDLHTKNVMIRPGTKELVITDPFWNGSTPYADYDAWVRSQGDLEHEPEMVRGGERYKKPAPPPSQPQPNGHIPF